VTQLFDVLDPATLAGLRDSVRRLGVLVPVAKDQHGNILDGHHRVQVADDLGVRYRVDVIQVADDEQADEIRRNLSGTSSYSRSSGSRPASGRFHSRRSPTARVQARRPSAGCSQLIH
jgi:hypothetical protein